MFCLFAATWVIAAVITLHSLNLRPNWYSMMFERYELKPSVLSEIHRCFSANDIAYVKSKLETSELCWGDNAPPARVHVALIWLSKGCRETFDRELDVALADWRNTLMNTGLAEAGWKSTLASRNINCENW